MATAGGALARGRASLQADSEHPARDAVLLLAHVLGKPSEYPYLHPEAELSPAQEREYLELVERRRAGEPVAYLRGYQEFMGLRFRVDRRVLIPRPETEILVEAVLKALGDRPVVADIGCGSGAIGLSLARLKSAAQVILTDSSLDALDVAGANAASLAVSDRARFLQGDLAAPLLDAGLAGMFDAAVSNPPYIPREEMDGLPREVRRFEPALALDGGPGGLVIVARLAEEVPALLKPGGRFFMEIGDGQGDACRAIFAGIRAWQEFEALPDYSGRQRVFEARTRSAG
jgi:release factor glutamine methyltransferase